MNLGKIVLRTCSDLCCVSDDSHDVTMTIHRLEGFKPYRDQAEGKGTRVESCFAE